MNRKPVLAVLICYCLLALTFAMLGVATVPTTAYADGGAEPPTKPPSDSTQNAVSPTETTPAPVTETVPEKSLTLRMYLEIVAGIIL